MSNILSNTDMALLMFVSAMLKQFVVSIEWVFTKCTVWVPSESRFVILVKGFVTKLVMLRQLTWSEESVLMCEDLFESSAQITDDNQIWVCVSITKCSNPSKWLLTITVDRAPSWHASSVPTNLPHKQHRMLARDNWTEVKAWNLERFADLQSEYSNACLSVEYWPWYILDMAWQDPLWRWPSSAPSTMSWRIY